MRRDVAGRTNAPNRPVDASGLRFAIVVAEFNADITDRLLTSARGCLANNGIADEDVEEFRVPGAFEIPLVARLLAETDQFDAVVCLGCVIRGETPHFDYISAACAQGLTAAALETGVPMAFGVLTTDDRRQALARSGPGLDGKGWDAAATAMRMAVLCGEIAGMMEDEEG